MKYVVEYMAAGVLVEIFPRRVEKIIFRYRQTDDKRLQQLITHTWEERNLEVGKTSRKAIGR